MTHSSARRRDRHDEPCLFSIDVAAGRIAVYGELDRRSVHHLVAAVAALGGSSSPSWSVDVSRVTFCDVVGLRALRQARALAGDTGRSFAVVGPGGWLRRLLLLVDLESVDLESVDLPSCRTPAPRRPTRAVVHGGTIAAGPRG